MDIAHLIAHPECLDQDTLYELRECVGTTPYFHAARILLLQNLFLLHTPSFDQELRRAAVSLPDRSVLFDMIESRNYEIHYAAKPKAEPETPTVPTNRTLDLIDQFLLTNTTPKRTKQRTPDPSADYMAYLSEKEAQDEATPPTPEPTAKPAERVITPATEITPMASERDDAMEEELPTEAFYTETLAKIHIKQGNYQRAIDILQAINLRNPKKSVYFADQIRFLQKLIINNKHNS